jgi:hypothetical protein
MGLFGGILTTLFALWLVSVLMLRRWKKFFQFFFLNAILVVTYSVVPPSLWPKFYGQGYGLSLFVVPSFIAATHIVIVFGFAVHMRRKLETD